MVHTVTSRPLYSVLMNPCVMSTNGEQRAAGTAPTMINLSILFQSRTLSSRLPTEFVQTSFANLFWKGAVLTSSPKLSHFVYKIACTYLIPMDFHFPLRELRL